MKIKIVICQSEWSTFVFLFKWNASDLPTKPFWHTQEPFSLTQEPFRLTSTTFCFIHKTFWHTRKTFWLTHEAICLTLKPFWRTRTILCQTYRTMNCCESENALRIGTQIVDNRHLTLLKQCRYPKKSTFEQALKILNQCFKFVQVSWCVKTLKRAWYIFKSSLFTRVNKISQSKWHWHIMYNITSSNLARCFLKIWKWAHDDHSGF